MKISLVCGFELPSYDGTGFSPSLGISEIGYFCVRAPELHLLRMAHPFGSLDASEGVLLLRQGRNIYSLATLPGYWRFGPVKDHHDHS